MDIYIVFYPGAEANIFVAAFLKERDAQKYIVATKTPKSLFYEDYEIL